MSHAHAIRTTVDKLDRKLNEWAPGATFLQVVSTGGRDVVIAVVHGEHDTDERDAAGPPSDATCELCGWGMAATPHVVYASRGLAGGWTGITRNAGDGVVHKVCAHPLIWRGRTWETGDGTRAASGETDHPAPLAIEYGPAPAYEVGDVYGVVGDPDTMRWFVLTPTRIVALFAGASDHSPETFAHHYDGRAYLVQRATVYGLRRTAVASSVAVGDRVFVDGTPVTVLSRELCDVAVGSGAKAAAMYVRNDLGHQWWILRGVSEPFRTAPDADVQTGT